MNEPVRAKQGHKRDLHPRLVEAMKARGHNSVPALARATGIHMQTLYNVFGGRNTASVEVAVLIAEELSLSLKDMREIFLDKKGGSNFNGCVKIASANPIQNQGLLTKTA